MAEYTQLYIEQPPVIGEAPLGLTPAGFDDPAMIPVGTGLITPRYNTTGQSAPARPSTPYGHAQYTQRVDESVYVARPQLVPGLRGKATHFQVQPDFLTQPPIGPIYETNGGFPWTYLPQRVKAFRATEPVLNVYNNGRFVKNYRFRAQHIAELSTSQCS